MKNFDFHKKEAGLMNVEKLIEHNESISKVTFPISDKELLSRFEQLYTGAVSDVLRERCLLEQALPMRIRALREYRTVAGFAFTVKSAPNMMIKGEMDYRNQMLEKYHEDAFVVWDTSGDQKAAAWGGVMSTLAKSRKLKGACLDGGLRDTFQVLESGLPVFYDYHIPNGSLGRCMITHYQIPILVGDVIIRPGDVVVGDLDGVVIVPRDVAYDVLIRAEEIKKIEDDIFVWVKEKKSVKYISEHGGYF